MTTDNKIDLLLEKQKKLKYQLHAGIGSVNVAIWTLTALASQTSRPIWYIFSILFAFLGVIQFVASHAKLGIGYFFGKQDDEHLKK